MKLIDRIKSLFDPWRAWRRRLAIPDEWARTGGRGATALVIDTGAPEHPDLSRAVDYAKCRTFLWDYSFEDRNGHATAVCSVIHDWAPEARIVCYRVAGEDGKTDSTAVRAALEHAAGLAPGELPDVVNISLAAGNGASKWRNPIRQLHKLGVPVICGAGNSGGAASYPARFPETVAVGAIDRKGRVCGFSARGEGVDAYMPGEHVRARSLGGGWGTASGTSVAAACASGIAALAAAFSKDTGYGGVTPELTREALARASRLAGVDETA